MKSLALLAALLLTGAFVAPPLPQEPPSVLVLILDDVALTDVDRLELPTLDRLAERGILLMVELLGWMCGHASLLPSNVQGTISANGE